MNKLMAIIAAIVVFSALQMSYASALGITLSLSTQTPYPVEPGKIVDIEVSVYNSGTTSDTFTLEILPDSPFTLLSGEKVATTFTNLGPLSTRTQSYRLRVSDTAVSADYDLDFRITRPGSTGSTTKSVSVTVQGTPKIVIEEIKTAPAIIEPGHEVEVEITLKNVGSGDASQLEFNLEADADPETDENLIVPILSGGSFYMETLKSGEEGVATFRLDIDNSAEYKSYTSTLTIVYNDESGTESTVTRDIGIPVKGIPVLEILSAKVENGDFKVDIENIGTGSAKALKIEFIQDGEVKDSSVASELKPTRQKTLRFAGFRYGEATVKISYLDESNEVFEKETTVTVKESATSSDGSGTDYSGYVGVLLLLVVVEGFYIWRLRKKLKRKK
ncbi:MAG: hypothetical protein JW789_05185 [Candidatus Aenigmarchaeota archaeon]|nr:hypothetical protein [Candidatus Aenigmarchaeota archaeon]